MILYLSGEPGGCIIYHWAELSLFDAVKTTWPELKTHLAHTQLYFSEYTHTSICPKISIAALYYIKYAFDKCHQ